jgi:hypothetical protein
MRSALRAWASSVSGIAVQADAATAALSDEAERELRRRVARLRALEDALRAAPPEDRGALAEAVRQAAASADRARHAVGLANEARQRSQALQRRVQPVATGLVDRGCRVLERKLRALGDYASAPVPTPSGRPTGGAVNYGVPGLVDIPVDLADFSDNPILDGFHRGGADIADYRWAIETWETVVRPGVLSGKTRDDFQRRDAAQGRYVGMRRTAGVYDMFLGDDPIAISRRPDGTFDVGSGRHRIAVARELGINHLPGRILG